jgi:hypothetical protein
MSGPLALRARFREAFNENSHVREEKLNDIAYAAGGSRNWRGTGLGLAVALTSGPRQLSGCGAGARSRGGFPGKYRIPPV